MKKIVIIPILILILVISNIILFLPVKAESKTIIVPDDYSDIQTAINHANNGDTVFVKAGTYSISWYLTQIVIDKSISLMGENSKNTIISNIPTKYGVAMIQVRATNVKISGFTLIGNEIGIGIRVENSTCTITNNYITGTTDSAIRVYSSFNGNILTGNNITGNGSFGIYLSSDDSIISNNTITDNKATGIIVDACKNVTISQNNIKQNGAGLTLSKGPFYVNNNNISDNSGFGIQLGINCNNATVKMNSLDFNQYGICLLNYVINPSGSINLGRGNQVYSNNIENNSKNAFISQVSNFIPKLSEGDVGNGTDIVSWDNSSIGNHWSDYQTKYPNVTEIDTSGIGNVPYIIAENNIDHYPLLHQIDISKETSSSSEPQPKPESFPIISVTASIGIIAIASVSLLIYFKKHKHRVDNT